MSNQRKPPIQPKDRVRIDHAAVSANVVTAVAAIQEEAS